MRQCPCSMHAQCTKDATAVERSAWPMHSPRTRSVGMWDDKSPVVVGITIFVSDLVLANGSSSQCRYEAYHFPTHCLNREFSLALESGTKKVVAAPMIVFGRDMNDGFLLVSSLPLSRVFLGGALTANL